MKKSFVAILIFILVGCMPSGITARPAQTDTPFGSPTPTHTLIPIVKPTLQSPSPTRPTVSQTPSLLPVPPLHATPDEFPEPMHIKMFDENNGWLEVGYASEPDHLFHTQDGGASWQDVSPITSTRFLSRAYLNAQTAWELASPAAPSSGDQPGTLFRTDDGGKTWSSNSVPFSNQVYLTFLDSQNGRAEWVTVCGAGTCMARFYQTSDGGRTWSQMMVSNPNGPEQLPPGTVHFSDGYYFSFVNANTIWLAGNGCCAYPYADLFVSRDNGLTWKQENIPLSRRDPNSGSPDFISLPTFFTEKDGIFAASYEGFHTKVTDPYQDYEMATFITHDGGQTWVQTPALLKGNFTLYQVHFITQNDANVLCGHNLCVTHDGYKTWEVIQSNLGINSDDNRPLVDFDYISPSTGWAILGIPDHNQLYKTTDGGVFWEELKVILTTANSIASSVPLDSTKTSSPVSILSNPFIKLAIWGKGAIKDVAYSPDGARLGVVTTRGVYIYAAESQKQLDFFPGESFPPVATFSPDWSLLATGSGDTITIQRLEDKSEIEHMVTDKGTVSRLLFSPDGRMLASLVRPPGEEVYTLILDLWDPASGKLLGSWEAGSMPGVVFTPDSQAIYSYNPVRMDGVHRWKVPSGTPLPVIYDFHPQILLFSSDGRYMISTGLDSEHLGILVQDAQDGTVVNKLNWERHEPLEMLAITKDSSKLIAYAKNGYIRVWKLPEGILVSSYAISLPSNDTFMTISPDGQSLAVPLAEDLNFYDLSNGQVLNRLDGHLDSIWKASISPHENRVAALVGGLGSEANSLMVWTFPNGQLLYAVPNIGALDLAWSPQGDRLAVGGWDRQVHLLDPLDGKTLQSLPGHSEQVQSVAWSPDGALIASSSMKSVKVWQVGSGMLLKDLSAPGGWYDRLWFTPDGLMLAGRGADGYIRFWQGTAGDAQPVNEIPISTSAANEVAYAPDGSYLAIAEQNRIWLHHIDENKPFQTLPVIDSAVVAMTISTDGSLLSVGLVNGSVQIWRLPEGKLLQTLQGPSLAMPSSLDFTSDRKILLAAFHDGTIQVWGIPK